MTHPEKSRFRVGRVAHLTAQAATLDFHQRLLLPEKQPREDGAADRRVLASIRDATGKAGARPALPPQLLAASPRQPPLAGPDPAGKAPRATTPSQETSASHELGRFLGWRRDHCRHSARTHRAFPPSHWFWAARAQARAVTPSASSRKLGAAAPIAPPQKQAMRRWPSASPLIERGAARSGERLKPPSNSHRRSPPRRHRDDQSSWIA